MPDRLTYLLNWWICSLFSMQVSKSNVAWSCITRGTKKCMVIGLAPLDTELLKHCLHYDSRFDYTTTSPKLSPHLTCGKRFPDVRYIIGGDDATENAWPWQVMVLSKGDNYSATCGGTVISKYWVLTAAHCLKTSEVTVFVGITKLHLINEENIFLSSRVIPHENFVPAFKRSGSLNDIGLIKLKYPLPFSNSVIPACLPGPAQSKFESKQFCYITGFGNKDPILDENSSMAFRLQELRVVVLSQKKCQERMPFLFGENFVKDSYICVKGKSHIRAGACRGDSGGPLMCLIDGIYHVVGVASFGDPLCFQIYPNIYTRVSKFIDWILKQLVTYS